MKLFVFAFGALAVLSAPVASLAQAPSPAPAAAAAAPPAPPYGTPITLEQARVVVAAAEAEARKRNVAVTIVVVEPNGTIVLSERMNGASYASSETAPNKARSAAVWMRPTSSWIEAARNSPGVIGMAQVVATNGGELIVSGGRTIGAIGVGGSAPNEGDIAKIAVAAVK
jgi:glc operon protein GlcG